jgi:hypothetical protein
MDCDAQGQLGLQVEPMCGHIHTLDQDMNVPLPPQGPGLGENFLAELGREE